MYTIRKAKEEIKNGIRAELFKNENGNYMVKCVNRLPYYLEGAPGLGKTEIVKQIANELNIGFVNFSMVHHTRNSILGLPVISTLDNGEKYTQFTMSEVIANVWAMEAKGYTEGILLLDEFPCMSETVMPAMLAFLQTKNIGTHFLPEGWVIVLCGNPREYNRSVIDMDSAITDRIRKLEIEFSIDDFLDYSKESGLCSVVTGYLEINKKDGYSFEKDNRSSIVTSRSWENLGHSIESYRRIGANIDIEFVKQYIKNNRIANDFYAYYCQHMTGISYDMIEEILTGNVDDKLVGNLNKLDYENKWKVCENILHYIENTNEEYVNGYAMGKKKENSVGIKKMTEISKKIDRAFDIASLVEEGDTLRERMYYYVGKSPLLIKVVCTVPSENYLKMCESKIVFD